MGISKDINKSVDRFLETARDRAGKKDVVLGAIKSILAVLQAQIDKLQEALDLNKSYRIEVGISGQSRIVYQREVIGEELELSVVMGGINLVTNSNQDKFDWVSLEVLVAIRAELHDHVDLLCAELDSYYGPKTHE